jgi:hypothetical protein
MSSLTPVADRDASLKNLSTLDDKNQANETRIRQALILFAPPKPSVQMPHHNNHPVSVLDINVGKENDMDAGRWFQKVRSF